MLLVDDVATGANMRAALERCGGRVRRESWWSCPLLRVHVPGSGWRLGPNRVRDHAHTGRRHRPRTERRSHYFRARIAHRFDALIHIEETRALEPLDGTSRWEAGETARTYPFAV
ncbi:erythromycin esterase family protein [Nocardia sp. NPDC051900]|uniref:erythromycin esterase family protein n=1 Tax=Nocardia sp. NPDC051900 TaxID=3364326 RepID=UPI00379B7C3C